MALATDISEGEIQLTGDLAGDGGAQIGSNPQLTHMPGLTPGQYINPKMTVDAKGRVSAIVAATPSEIGATLPVATSSTVGVVSVGDHLYMVDADTQGYQVINFGSYYVGSPDPSTGLAACGTYSVDIQVDGGTTYTVSATGADLATAQDVVDVINAQTTGVTATLDTGDIIITSNEQGRGSMIDVLNDSMFQCMTNFVEIQTAVDGTASCEIYAKDATDSVSGVVQIGDGIDVDAGVISVGIATTTTIGQVIVPTSGNIDVDVNGNISVPVATGGSVGVVSIGSGLSVDGNGEVTLNLPIASDTILGGVKEGTGVSIDVDGTISTTPGSIPAATSITLGGVIVPGGSGSPFVSDGLSVDGSGNLTYTPSSNIATTTTPGNVIVPESGYIDVDVDGNISVPLSSIGSPLNFGIVKSGDTNNITITSGDIDVGPNVAKINVQNTYTKSQNVATTTLSSVSNSTSVDATLSNTFSLTLNENTTLQDPSGLSTGASYVFILKQDATGGRTLSFGSAYKFREGLSPVITSAANGVDVMSCISDGTNLYCAYNKDFS